MTEPQPSYLGVRRPERELSGSEIRSLAIALADELSKRVPRQSLSVKHAAEALEVSETYLRTLMDSGQLAYVKLGDRRVIRPRDLEDLLERHLKRGVA